MTSPDAPRDARATATPSEAVAEREGVEAEDHSFLARLETALAGRYAAFVAAVGIALLVLLALAAYAQGGDGQHVRRALWLLGLEPVMIVYIFVVHPFMHRRWQGAVRSLDALARDGAERAEPKPASRRGEWAAMLAGTLIGLAIARRAPGAEGWLWWYAEATSALLFALLAGAIYGSVARSRHLAARTRAGLSLSVFDGHLLAPFARWGQSLTLVFVGGISLSLLFQSSESLRSVEGVVVYGSLVVVALTLFFTSMWTIHVALAKAQRTELARVREDLAAARAALAEQRGRVARAAVHEVYAPAVVLGQYERQLLEASTWPFDPRIVGRVFASAAAPLGVYVLKLAFGVGGAL